MNTPINANIEITSVAFNRTPRTARLQSFPKRMVWDDREYTFVESGMQYLVQKGQQLIRLFDVSDGTTNYRLKCDEASNHWTLVSLRTA